MLKVRDLVNAEVAQLNRLLDSNDMDIPKDRLRIVYLSWQGKTISEIGDLVDLHPINIRKWIHRYNAQGIRGLITKAIPGRPAIFDSAKRKRIREIYQSHPRQNGRSFNEWSYNKLKEYIIEIGLVENISLETIRGIVNPR